MKLPAVSLRRVAFVLAAMVLAAGLIAPLLNANRFRAQIQSALEQALNRRVTLGKVHFNLFTGPGFTLDDVLIEEAQGMGIEPFAHVEALQARIHVASLWTGKLAFSNLKLVEPSVNFVKAGDGPWNVQPLVTRAASANASSYQQLPEIQILGGRLNFKFGDTKSVFYISNADLDVYSNQRGDLVIRFSGEPSRTDHTAQGLGRLVARGVLKSDQLSMSVQLERTEIQELTRLFDIQDLGVRGSVASNLKLDGPLSAINLSGDLRIEDIHRWDMMPNKGEGWTLGYAGLLNLADQSVEIKTKSTGKQESPVNGRFVATQYLTAPKWQASLSFQELAAASFLDTARRMGAPFPAGATLDGKVAGELEYSALEGMRGEFVLHDAAFHFPQGGAIEFESAPLSIAANTVHLGPAEVKFPENEIAQLEARYALDSKTFRLDLTSGLLGIVPTRELVGRLLGTAAVPFLDRCKQGSWRGKITYVRQDDAEGSWTGDMEVQNANLEIAGLLLPLRLASALVEFQTDQTLVSRIKGRIGTVGLEGDYRWLNSGERPDRARLILGDLDMAELEKLLQPTLRTQQGFLARALRLERTKPPDWLASRRLEGSLQVRNLRMSETPLGTLRAKIAWHATSVDLTDIETKLETKAEARQEAMRTNGKLTVQLDRGVPRYQWAGQIQGMDYRGGLLSLEGKAETNGLGADLGLNAKADGFFTGSEIALAPDSQVDEISGVFRLDPSGAGPKLTLSKVQVTQGQEVFHGQGVSQSDGKLTLELTSARRQMRLTGTLLPIRTATPPQ